MSNAKKAFRGDARQAAVEAACAAVHAVRYGCGGGAAPADKAVAAELVERTNLSNEETQGEFCEA